MVDMKAVIGENADISNVSIITEGWSLDKTTGIATYSGSDCPEIMEYTYDVSSGRAEDLLLYVSITLNNMQLAMAIDAEEANDATTTPQTSDGSDIIAYLTIGALAAAGAAMLAVSYKLKED